MPPSTTHIRKIFFGEKYQKDPTIFSYLKIYPDMAKFIEYHKPYNRQAYYDPAVDSQLPSRTRSKPITQSQQDISVLESLRRSKTVISDIVLSNKFDMWATFTFNGKKENQKKLGLRATTDRYDIELCKKKMSKWLKNQRELHGSFDYLIVGEFHKDGALHFHAFLNNYKGHLDAVGKIKHGKKVYRIKSYKLGMSEMQLIGQTEEDYRKISSYIKKYITKDMPIFAGKKRYWCSTGLIRPEIIKNPRQELLAQYAFEIKHKLEMLTIQRGTRTVQMPTN